MLENLFVSKVRVKLISYFLSHLNEKFYVRQLTRITNEQINAVRRELENLKNIGLLQSEGRGNRVYYFVNEQFSLLPELQSMTVKTFGLGKKIMDQVERLGALTFIVLAVPFLYGREPLHKDVDLIFVGTIKLGALKTLISSLEKEYGRAVNYTVFTDREFAFRKKRRDPFVISSLVQAKIMILGNEKDLVEIPQ